MRLFQVTYKETGEFQPESKIFVLANSVFAARIKVFKYLRKFHSAKEFILENIEKKEVVQ